MFGVRRKRLVTLSVAVMIAAAGCAESSVDAARQEEVARKGEKVMPFDLDRTTHTFEPLSNGGLQAVVADDPTDQGQIRLIRKHLRKEATAFSRGDFGDPAAIHGDSMPGLKQLEESYRNISVTFSETPDGATLRYRSGSSEAVDALHRWFEAQLMDHGEDARHGV